MDYTYPHLQKNLGILWLVFIVPICRGSTYSLWHDLAAVCQVPEVEYIQYFLEGYVIIVDLEVSLSHEPLARLVVRTAAWPKV